MKFLVRLTTTFPAGLSDDERARLLAAESARGRELVAAGTIEHLWRLPGRLANVGVWSVRDADELHAAIASLPLWRFMDVRVEALASHPLTEGAAEPLASQPAAGGAVDSR
ncbi:muconolactone Delta-isomerase [Paractinoplanes lichenicola]|uniref:muconolactone Delta-isomerase n=1 Tax=Paractinoplanes lichenicola TaxID=2802976 RepID=A0ABS1VRQ1_9ACTN|nr:muconolactone Delta-isomerase family protein [Actinoplanes lichenicola]MBL7256231.1 muconolactone Delta-isomerase family protein [Actinoplanes lichenicola]